MKKKQMGKFRILISLFASIRELKINLIENQGKLRKTDGEILNLNFPNFLNRGTEKKFNVKSIFKNEK